MKIIIVDIYSILWLDAQLWSVMVKQLFLHERIRILD